MYRSLLPVLLCIHAATTAPQDGGNSVITYVKLQPVIDDNSRAPAAIPRESRIENLPLTIPGNSEDGLKQPKVFESNSQTTVVKSDSNKSINLTDDSDSNLKRDTVPADTNRLDQQARSDFDFTTSSYESLETEFSEDVTERFGEFPGSTEAEEKLTKAPSKFSAKSSYFNKFGGPSSTNLIETSGKRRFRSKCRCEKIWNCPKLQITVPRCPDEYFLCCF